MSKARSDGTPTAIAALFLGGVLGAIGGCEALIGADFDVEPAATGEGGGAGGAASTAASTSSTTASAGNGGSTSTGPGECRTDAESIAEGEHLPWDVVVDETFVYWTRRGTPNTLDGEVRRRRKDLSSAVEVVAGSQAQPNRLVVAGPFLYWTATGIATDDGAVRFVDRSDIAEVSTAADGLGLPIGLAADEDSVYFVDREDLDVDGTPYMRASRAALGATTFAPFAAVPKFPTMIAVGQGVLFGSSLESNDASSLWTVLLDGTQAVASRVQERPPRPDAGLTHGGGTFAVTSASERRLDLYNQYGNVVRDGEGSTFGALGDIAFASGWFYFAEYGGETIWRVSPTSAAPECVVTGQPSVNGVAADGDRLYFTLHVEGGAVRSIALPP